MLPVDVQAFSVGAHAHYLGKQMRLTATLPNGDVKTLLRIDDWDFSWQERYRFADFVALRKGTRLDAEISYDNTSANKRNPNRPPVRVTWGEESNDEMGSIGLQVVAASPGELPQLRQAFLAHVRQAAVTRPGLGQLLLSRGYLFLRFVQLDQPLFHRLAFLRQRVTHSLPKNLEAADDLDVVQVVSAVVILK